MLFTAGLFNRFKCFWTSSFCLERGTLAAQVKEIKNPKKISAVTVVLILPLLNHSVAILNEINPGKEQKEGAAKPPRYAHVVG